MRAASTTVSRINGTKQKTRTARNTRECEKSQSISKPGIHTVAIFRAQIEIHVYWTNRESSGTVGGNFFPYSLLFCWIFFPFFEREHFPIFRVEWSRAVGRRNSLTFSEAGLRKAFPFAGLNPFYTSAVPRHRHTVGCARSNWSETSNTTNFGYSQIMWHLTRDPHPSHSMATLAHSSNSAKQLR